MMIEEKMFKFTQEEECQAAHTNLISLILVTNRYLQEHALDVATFWHFIGQHFAPGWTDVAQADIQEVSRRILLNMASCGGQLDSMKVENEQAEFVIQGWPPEDFAQFFAISAEDAAQMVEVFRPITASLSIAYDWQLEHGAVKMHLQKE
jgi:hypothetical protein